MPGVIAHMLNRTLTVKRPMTTTTAGRTGKSYAAHLSAVRCRAHQMSGSESVRHGAERGVNLWRFSVQPSYDILAGDQVTFVDPDGVTHIVDIKSVRNSAYGLSGSASTIKVIEGEEVRGGG